MSAQRSRLLLATSFGLVATACALATPGITRRLIDEAILSNERSLILPLTAAVFGLGMVQQAAIFLRQNTAGTISIRIETHLRTRLFDKLQRLPMSFHDRSGAGQLIARMTGDARAIGEFSGRSLVFLAYLALLTIGVAIMLVRLDRTLAVLTILSLIPFPLAAMIFNRRIRRVELRSREQAGEVTAIVEENILGMQTLDALGQRSAASIRLEEAVARLRKINLSGVAVRSTYLPILAWIPNITLAVILAIGGHKVISHDITLGTLVAFNQHLASWVLSLRSLGVNLAMAQQASAALHRVNTVLKEEPDITDFSLSQAVGGLTGRVEFHAVSVTLPGRQRPALESISFVAMPGETVALVGASGSGKTTLAKLLPRLLEPTSGFVSIDDIDLRQMTLSSARAQVGVAFADTVLFSSTVAENISLGSQDASLDRIHIVAKACEAHDFIAALPAGYHTPVGERGCSLSGGQRQRVALARALLSDAPILVLDDPLSAVDLATRAAIVDRITPLLARRTVILITDHVPLLRSADRVLLLETGKISARGSHDDLAASNKMYRQLLGLHG